MIRFSFCLLLCVAVLLMVPNAPRAAAGASDSNAPEYTADGKLMFPANYREWIYLTTGMDMDYNPELQTMDHSMFDNIFVNPEAYKAFVATGTWPDKTIMVLEGRMAANKGSINQKGHYQTNDIMARSIHIKDEAHFPGKWAFVGFGDANVGRTFPKEAVCYSCHEQHGAVDTTFVQFYPTLLEIATKKGTLSPAYVKEEAANAKK
ncbi:MAG: cytochrome P460 family protein [Bryobacteraceae bacterium]